MTHARWFAGGCCGVLLLMLGGAAHSDPQSAGPIVANDDLRNNANVSPPPLDLFEPVTSRPETVEGPDARQEIITLLNHSFQKRAAIVGPRYTVRVSFTAAGQVQEVGPGEMDETGSGGDHRRWTGHVGGFSMVRIIRDQPYDSIPPGPIPMRLHQVRGNVLGPPPPSTWGVIRTARAAENGVLITCILTSANGSSAPVRDWTEIEYCVDADSGFLRIFSAAPGIYVHYDYANSSTTRGHTPPTQFAVVEAGQVVLQGNISASVATREELNPSLFTPTTGMYIGGLGMIGASFQTQVRSRAAGSGALQPVVIHAILAPDGSVVEAESLQISNAALSESALELVKKTKYQSTFNYGYSPQQEIFVTVE